MSDIDLATVISEAIKEVAKAIRYLADVEREISENEIAADKEMSEMHAIQTVVRTPTEYEPWEKSEKAEDAEDEEEASRDLPKNRNPFPWAREVVSGKLVLGDVLLTPDPQDLVDYDEAADIAEMETRIKKESGEEKPDEEDDWDRSGA
ncbi:MAG: hypothetical protein O3C40_31780 [Planctomycetota bacterium]|nr:hypothetical protein [Planctomycetota bacterium]